MQYSIRPSARQAFSELVTYNRRLLIGDVGSGKTALVLSAAVFREEWVAPVFPLLVVSHSTVAKSTWLEEAAQWDQFKKLSVRSLHGIAEQRLKILNEGADIYTISFNLMPWLLKQPGALQVFRNIVIDESTRLAGLRAFWRRDRVVLAGSVQAKSIARFALQDTRQWVVELTGTPIARGLQALYGQMFLIDGCRSLGVRSFSAFADLYMEPKFPGAQTLVPREGAEVKAMKAVEYRVSSVEHHTTEGVGVVEHVEYVELPTDMLKRYKRLEQQAIMELDSATLTLPLAAAAQSQKLLQFASGHSYVSDEDMPESLQHCRTGGTVIFTAHEEKVKALRVLIARIGRPTIVVYYHKGSKHVLEKEGACIIDAANIDKKKLWDAGKIKLLALHWQTAFGLSLQAGGHDMVFFDLYWSGELLTQLIARIGPARQQASGFNRLTNIYYLVAKKTIDEEALALCRDRSATDRSAVTLMRRLKNA